MLRSLEGTGLVLPFCPGMRIIKLKSRDPADRGLSEEIRASMGFRKSQGEEIKVKSKHLLLAMGGQNSEDIFLCWRRFLL